MGIYEEICTVKRNVSILLENLQLGDLTEIDAEQLNDLIKLGERLTTEVSKLVETPVDSSPIHKENLTQYAVGTCSFDDDINVVVISADTEFNAVCQAVNQKYGWDMTQEVEFVDVKSIDDLITFALQGDIVVSNPTII